MYNNEASVGNGIVASGVSRSSLFVTTKLAKPAAVYSSGSAAEGVKAKLQQELHELQLDYVDLYLWHTPVGYEGRIAEIWKGFELVKKEGRETRWGIQLPGSGSRGNPQQYPRHPTRNQSGECRILSRVQSPSLDQKTEQLTLFRRSNSIPMF